MTAFGTKFPDARIDTDGVDALVTASHLTHDVGGHWALIDVEIVRPPPRSVVACGGRATTTVGCHWIVTLALRQATKPLIPGQKRGVPRVPLLLKTYTCTSILISKDPVR